jgi:hypothetical protein
MMAIVFPDMDRQPFIVDFNDPKDIASKLADAERILDETNQQLAEVVPLQRKAEEWRVNVEFLRSKVGSAVTEAQRVSANGTALSRPPANADAPVQAGAVAGERPDVQSHVVGVVNREMRKIKASLVRDILADEGHDFSAEQVSNALHHAATGPKLIQKWPERGMYAPVGYQEPPLRIQEPSSWAASPVTLTVGGA